MRGAAAGALAVLAGERDPTTVSGSHYWWVVSSGQLRERARQEERGGVPLAPTRRPFRVAPAISLHFPYALPNFLLSFNFILAFNLFFPPSSTFTFVIPS